VYLGHSKKTSAKDKSIANVGSIRFVVLPYQNQAIKKKKSAAISVTKGLMMKLL